MDLGTALQLLSDPDRRRLLLRIREHNPEDAEQMPRETTDSDAEFRRAFSQMYHLHLPMLAAADVIAWDRDQNVIRRGPDYDELRPLLDLFHDHEEELPEEWME